MSASSEAEETTQFNLLTECLAAALQEPESSITLPDEVVVQFKSGTIKDDTSISKFKLLFGTLDHTNRLRLDHGAFINVVAILLHLPYSHDQEHVLFAFIRTINLLKDPKAVQATMAKTKNDPSTTEEIAVKYHKISHKLLHKMMQVLVLNKHESSMRLMASHILFALLHGNADAQEIARKYPEIAELGPLVDRDADYVLRVFTSNIIRDMCATTSEPHEFWPRSQEEQENTHENFPTAQIPDTIWLGAVADYLSSKDASRGLRDHSQPLVSKILSVDTDNKVFNDHPRGNILAVVTDTLIFIIPGTPTSSLATLEFVLDPECECWIDEHTSPDNRSDIGDDVDVHIDTARRGYQVFEGKKSALDLAILVLLQYEQGEGFAQCVSRSLQLLPPLPRSEDRFAGIDVSSRAQSRSFRTIKYGMIDMSMESDTQGDAASTSDVSSIVEVEAGSSRRKMSRSWSRQSSRMTEAKLKEAQRAKPSESAKTAPQDFLRRDERQEIDPYPRSVDPRILTKSGREKGQSEVIVGLHMGMNFENYVEQSKIRAENELGRHAKPPQPAAGTRQDTIPTQRVESSPSNRIHRLTSKRHLETVRGTIDSRPPQQSLEPERLVSQASNSREISEHRKPLQPPTVPRPTGATSKKSTVNNTGFATQSKKPPQTALRLPRKSQSINTNPIDWDGGDMANENDVAPTAKKQKITKSSADHVSRQREDKTQLQEERVQIKDSGGASMLKRPKAIKSKTQKPQQTILNTGKDEFDIEDDGETAASAPKTGRATTKRSANAASNDIKSRVSKPAKRVTAKPPPKGRKALQPLHANKSLASSRPRRSQPKSKTYVEELDSEIEASNDEAENTSEKTGKDPAIPRQDLVAEHELEKSATTASRIRQNTLVPARLIVSRQPEEAQSGDELPSVPHVTVGSVAKTAEIATTHETLDTASPAQLGEVATRVAGRQHNTTPGLSKAKHHNKQLHQMTGAVEDESPGETAEDSYPKVATKSQGARDSFGTKLGQFLQNPEPHGMKVNVPTVQTTPFSNAKSFVGSVNKARTVSPKKPGQSARARRPNVKDVEVPLRAENLKMKETIGDTGTVSEAQTELQAIAPADDNMHFTEATSNDDRGQSIILQQTRQAASNEFKKLSAMRRSIMSIRETVSRATEAPMTPSVRQQKVEFDKSSPWQRVDAALPEHAQTFTAHEPIQPRNSHMTIDLAQDSDEALAVIGQGQTDHLQGDPGAKISATAANLYDSRVHDNEKTAHVQQRRQTSEQPPRIARPKLHAPEKTAQTKTPRHSKLPTAVGLPLRPDQVSFTSQALASGDSTTKKPKLVHFGTHGPQNQGIPSPEGHTCKSAAFPSATKETGELMNYKQSQSAAASRNPLKELSTHHANFPESADKAEHEDSGFIVDDDTFMEVGEAEQEHRQNAITEELAPVIHPHLPLERHAMVESRSQSSRVDQNGSPRLTPTSPKSSTHLDDSDMVVTAESPSDHNSAEKQDPTASHKESASDAEAPASRDSDRSFHLTHKASITRRSKRNIRSRTHTITTIISSPKAVKPIEQRPKAAAMMTKSMSRESLGLSKMVQDQYPEAQKFVATNLFKKPTLETTVSKALDVSTKIPIVGHRRQAQALNTDRKPLKDMSTNYNPPAHDYSSPMYFPERSAAAPKVPIRQHFASDSLGESAISFKTGLRMDHTNKAITEEDTILENLRRGKLAHDTSKDADQTLVEGDNIQQAGRQQLSDEPSVNSVYRQDEVRWRKGARDAQTSVRDALLEITNTVLIRLESEEKAIELKINDYETGCENVINRFRESQVKSFQRANQQVLKRATAESVKLSRAFGALQGRKEDVRSMATTTGLVERAVKEKQDLLTQAIEHMLAKERGGTTIPEEIAE